MPIGRACRRAVPPARPTTATPIVRPGRTRGRGRRAARPGSRRRPGAVLGRTAAGSGSGGIVRRAWLALVAVLLVAELVLWTRRPARPDRGRSRHRRGDPGDRAGRPARRRPWLRGRGSARRRSPSTPRAGSAIGWRSALALAVAFPDSAAPPRTTNAPDPATAIDEAAETERFVRRQRRDARRRLAARAAGPVPARASRSRPAAVAAVVAAARSRRRSCSRTRRTPSIAQQQQVREEASARRSGSTRSPRTSSRRARDAEDPRTRLAEELRELARQLREQPGRPRREPGRARRVETDVRAQLDPANEQRASSLSSLSRVAVADRDRRPDANSDGDPEEARRRTSRSWATSSTR